jgi:hypothetical protein
MHMAGGDAQGGEGGCTCILCIPPGYAPASTSKHEISTLFSIFVGNFCPRGSGSETLLDLRNIRHKNEIANKY